MKRLATVPVVLLLTGCGPTFPTIDGVALREAVAQVQAATVQACQYLPTNETVVAILTTGEVLETAYNIARQICDAVTETVSAVGPAQMQEPRLGDADQCPMVRGVCVEGRFIAPKQSDRPQEDVGP
jgi:hypothetical protein